MERLRAMGEAAEPSQLLPAAIGRIDRLVARLEELSEAVQSMLRLPPEPPPPADERQIDRPTLSSPVPLIRERADWIHGLAVRLEGTSTVLEKVLKALHEL
ncbi:MAG: hypothetical protein QME75_04910 [Deltaproteobacteria bacterium]|nr:hypothetical protein [Deltaproteobacteria bacterium]